MNTLVGVANMFAIEGNLARAVELLVLVQDHPRSPAEAIDAAKSLYEELEEELPSTVFQEIFQVVVGPLPHIAPAALG